MFGSITWFHKLMIALVIINLLTVLYWNDRTKKKSLRTRAEADKKHWLEKEITNLWRIFVETEDGTRYESEPQLPKCEITYAYDGAPPRLYKHTSLRVSQALIDKAMTNGYFTVGQVTIPTRLVTKAGVISVTIQRKA